MLCGVPHPWDDPLRSKQVHHGLGMRLTASSDDAKVKPSLEVSAPKIEKSVS